MINYVGIDPGSSITNPGGIARISDIGIECVRSLPVDKLELLRMISSIVNCDSVVVLERQWARPGNGMFSTWSMAECYGSIQMALVSLGASYSTVSPMTWQKCLLEAEGGTKKRSIITVGHRYPDFGKIKVKESGKADAINIATWLKSQGGDGSDNLWWESKGKAKPVRRKKAVSSVSGLK